MDGEEKQIYYDKQAAHGDLPRVQVQAQAEEGVHGPGEEGQDSRVQGVE